MTSGRSRVARIVLAVAVASAVCGCGGGSEGGSRTDCDLGGCTVTFVRDGTPQVSLLGITARLVGVQDDVATIEVAGQPVRLPVGQQTQAEGFTVVVERATDTEVVVRVSPGGGGG